MTTVTFTFNPQSGHSSRRAQRSYKGHTRMPKPVSRRPVAAPRPPVTAQPLPKPAAPQPKAPDFSLTAARAPLALEAKPARWEPVHALALSGALSSAPGGVDRVITGPNGARARELTHAYVSLKDGTKLKARIWLPLNASKENPCPLVLEALPYGAANGTEARDWVNHTQLASKGIGVVRLDVRGTGESTGSMPDEYTARERADITEAMGAVTHQEWANGKAAMMGNSWGAFNSVQVAAEPPPELKAVIMSCGSEDRYADDVHYKGGAVVGEQLVYGAAFLNFVGRPPDPLLLGKDWLPTWLDRMDKVEPVLPKWLSHADRSDGYWDTPGQKPGDVKVPVLAVGGYADSYHDSIPRMVERGAKGIIGPGGHGYPHLAAPGPAFPFLETAQKFLAKAFDMPGAQELPELTAYMQGRGWVEAEKPALRTGPLGKGVLTVKSPQTLGATSGKFCPMGVEGQLAGDQRADDAQSACVDLPGGVELLGAPEVKLKLRSDQPQGNVIVRLCDVAPDGASTRICYGVLNLAHRDGDQAPQPMTPGQDYDVKVKLDDCAYAVPPGHTLRVAVQNAYWPMFWPSEKPATLTIDAAASTLTLPEFRGRDAKVASPALDLSGSPVKPVTNDAYAVNERVDAKTGARVTDIRDGGGVTRDETGLEVRDFNTQHYAIDPKNPLSARASCAWTTELKRGDWSASVVSTATQRATATHFIIDSSLELKADGKVVLSKTWHHEVPRKNN
jgi:predicted acyl esterase